MKIILLNKILKLGYVGSKVIVKSGYAYNFLIPKGFSIIKKKKILLNNILNKDEKNKILFIILYIKCNNKGNLLSSINYKQIILCILNYNLKIKKSNINNFKSIKNIGEYIIKIKTNINKYKKISLKVFNKL